ncbi:hypothetical protein [Microbacterium deminutum]|uniref:Uncharacterized protein n=1 Tax=Microbacterium deminutum TaxID=344164 RepID=A0ABN2RKR0_9MICO
MAELDIEIVNRERIDVGDGITIPKAWDAVVTGEPGIPGTVRVKVVHDPVLKRAAAASVHIDRDGEGEEITTPAMREVRVQWAVQSSAVRLVKIARGCAEPTFLTAYLDGVHARTDRTFDDTVREAVVLYRIAATVNLAPLKFVSDELGVSVSTATRMMARARGAGLAVDLITRETYNRLRAEDERISRPIQMPGGPQGPSIGL